MSRRVYLLGVGLTLIGLALGFTDWVLSLQPGVTEANARRIHHGMRLKDVEAILGGTAQRSMYPQRDENVMARIWYGREGRVIVRFWLDDQSGVVGEPIFLPARSTQNEFSLLARLRAWLSW